MNKLFVSAMLAILIGIGAFIHHGNPTARSEKLDYDCVVYLPHSDYQQPDDFNNWMETLPRFTNLDYRNGRWYADDKVVAYGRSEDGAITNGKCGD